MVFFDECVFVVVVFVWVVDVLVFVECCEDLCVFCEVDQVGGECVVYWMCVGVWGVVYYVVVDLYVEVVVLYEEDDVDVIEVLFVLDVDWIVYVGVVCVVFVEVFVYGVYGWFFLVVLCC